MPRVIFKDKNVVYLSLSPDHAVEAEEEEMKNNKKVTAIYLLESVTEFDVTALLSCREATLT
jgi:hypothetical protein